MRKWTLVLVVLVVAVFLFSGACFGQGEEEFYTPDPATQVGPGQTTIPPTPPAPQPPQFAPNGVPAGAPGCDELPLGESGEDHVRAARLVLSGAFAPRNHSHHGSRGPRGLPGKNGRDGRDGRDAVPVVPPAVPGPTASATTAAPSAATGGAGMVPGLNIPWSWLIWAAIIITIAVLARNAARSAARREERMVNNAPALVAVQRHAMQLPAVPAPIGPSEGDSLAIHRDGYGNISGIERHRWPVRAERPDVRVGLQPGEGAITVGPGEARMFQVPPLPNHGQVQPQRGNGPAADAAAGRPRRNGNNGATTRRVETAEPAPEGAGQAAVEAVRNNGQAGH